jgi:tetratricopeptide (TPR) repeat protein
MHRKALPGEHPGRGQLRYELAAVLLAQGRTEEAERESRQALEILKLAWGPDDPFVSSSREQLARILFAQGQLGDAENQLRRALEAMQEANGPDALPRAVGAIGHNLAKVLAAQERYPEAEAQLRRTLETQVASLGPDHPDVVLTQSSLATVLLQRGNTDEAAIWAERVLTRADAPVVRADAAFLLATILANAETASDRARVEKLVGIARRNYASAGSAYQQDAERVRTWSESLE